ncbi:MAG: hypothetical protein EOO15_18995 [Chitinophagaceae bacterium]|nr:MAG: hypothetical protein EOO15_18995 [Chitinophagaceae bacterium]
MKKMLLAAALLTAGFASVPVSYVQAAQVAPAPVPKPVQNAFAALEAYYASCNCVLTNVVWTKTGGGYYTATFVIVNLSIEDSYTEGSATFHPGGKPA